jgi:hypothetical protein
VAPEVLAGDPADARANVCALGAMLYEMVAQRGRSASRRRRPCTRRYGAGGPAQHASGRGAPGRIVRQADDLAIKKAVFMASDYPGYLAGAKVTNGSRAGGPKAGAGVR